MKKIYSLLLACIGCIFGASAQIMTTSPEILTESSSDVVLYYHADSPLGNDGLKGQPSSAEIYAHAGVITNKSTGDTDWKYAPAKGWGDNSPKYKLEYVSPNVWALKIGKIREYFEISDASEKVKKIALVFRTADTTKEGKTKANGDIYVEVHEDGFALEFSTSNESRAVTSPTTFNFKAITTENATITIKAGETTIAQQSGVTNLTAQYALTQPGSIDVTATATNGTETLTQTISIAYVQASPAEAYPGLSTSVAPPMGAVKNPDGSVTFCICADQKSSVVLVPSWDDYKILDKNLMKLHSYRGGQHKYFWITVEGLKDDVYYPYYFLIDGVYKVGDPYARIVLDMYSDKWKDELDTAWPGRPQYPYDKFDDTMLAVYRGDLEGNYNFSDFTIPNHDNLVIYELLLRDFTGDEGQANGTGTLRQAMEKLDYLKDLGVNAVELLPIMEFNGNKSWGYNTNFYFAIDKAYGSPQDLKDFVEGCHRRGMAVILDIVFNQSDGLHPWYQMYDISKNPFYNQTAPHSYSVLNDWKQENEIVRQQFKDALRFWMRVYNVDGYRFDLVKGLADSGAYGNTDGYIKSRINNMIDFHSAIKEVKPDGIHINEHLLDNKNENNELAADGQLNWVSAGAFNAQDYIKGSGSGNLENFYKNGNNDPFTTIAYAESHDEQRIAYQGMNSTNSSIKNKKDVVMKRAGQVAVQLMMSPGSKMIWQFGELGDSQNTKDGNNNDTGNKKVLWDTLNDADIKALHDTYQALCYFRKDNPTLFDRTAKFNYYNTTSAPTSTMRYMQLTQGDLEVIAVINPNPSAAQSSQTSNMIFKNSTPKINTSNYQVITASKGYEPKLSGQGTNWYLPSMPANSYVVLATSNAVGVDDIVADSPAAKVQVYGGYGEIVIAGDYDNVAVYDLSGRVHSTTGLVAGLYIVKVDGETFKVKVQ